MTENRIRDDRNNLLLLKQRILYSFLRNESTKQVNKKEKKRNATYDKLHFLTRGEQDGTKRFDSNSFPFFLATFHGPVSLLYPPAHAVKRPSAISNSDKNSRAKGKRSRHSFSNDAKRLSSIILENAPFRWCDSGFQTEGSIPPFLSWGGRRRGGGSLIKRPRIKRGALPGEFESRACFVNVNWAQFRSSDTVNRPPAG